MTAMSALQNPSNSTKQSTVTMAMVRSLVGVICLTHQREQTDELDQLYFLGLSDLTFEEFQILPAKVVRETEFWPAPAVLRRLAGVETEAQRFEREAREGLSFMLRWIRKHGIDGHARNGVKLRDAGRDSAGNWHPDEYEKIPPPPVPDHVRNTLNELGEGDTKAGVRQVARHPMLLGEGEERQSLGLELVAIDKFERRWFDAWKRAA